MAMLKIDPSVYKLAEGLTMREQRTLLHGRPTSSSWRAPARARPRSAGTSRRPIRPVDPARLAHWEKLSSDCATRTIRKMRDTTWTPPPASLRKPARFYRDLVTIGGEKRAAWNERHTVSASQLNHEVSGRQRNLFSAPLMADKYAGRRPRVARWLCHATCFLLICRRWVLPLPSLLLQLIAE